MLVANLKSNTVTPDRLRYQNPDAVKSRAYRQKSRPFLFPLGRWSVAKSRKVGFPLPVAMCYAMTVGATQCSIV
jgi:hypothetical protein